MTWKPTTEGQIWDLINREEADLPRELTCLWEAIRIMPAKWQLHPWGDIGGGFWVIAVIGQRAIWHNDIEGGFDISEFITHGTLVTYSCSQASLSEVLRWLLHFVDTGQAAWPRVSPPQPGIWPGNR